MCKLGVRGLVVVFWGLSSIVLAAACGDDSSTGNNNNNSNQVLCGNGALDGVEACDGTNLDGESCASLSLGSGSLACQADCTFDTTGCSAQAYCGNGVIEGAEVCDGTNLGFADCADAGFPGGGVLSCRMDCTWNTSGCVGGLCGDGQLDVPAGEQCDDGNIVAGDGCDASCQLEIPASCGDGTQDTGEECDDGASNSDTLPDACRTNCRLPYCGDGVADFGAGEQCDDGNLATGDGCNATCQIEAPSTCGDGTLDVGMGEECDDGNTAAGDGCDPSCQLEPVGTACGDSTVDANALEKCDPPEVMPADGSGCNATCNLSGVVTTLDTGTRVGGITSDNQYLWLAIGDCQNPTACGIARIDIAACVASPGTAACSPTFVTGGPGFCSCGAPVQALVDGDDQTATFASMGTLTTDGVTIWFAHRNVLREYDIASGVVTTVAGQDGSCAAVDGNGLGAYFHDTRGLTYWNGLVYMLDGCENVLRYFDPASGDVVTVAGTRDPDPTVTQQPPYTCPTNFTCVTGTPLEGFGTAAHFGSPRYLTADNAGNLYFVDTNGQAIWRYNTVTTWADILISGSAPGVTVGPYADGDVASTNIGRPRGIVSDGTSLYFAEQNYATVRQLQLSGLTTTTFVGTMGCAASDVGRQPRDGLGAETTQVFCRGAGNPPNGVPIFDLLMGSMSYNFAFRSIFMVDGQLIRRIE